MGVGAAEPPLHPTALHPGKSAAVWSAMVSSGKVSHVRRRSYRRCVCTHTRATPGQSAAYHLEGAVQHSALKASYSVAAYLLHR
jgi:hypothetical protein